MTRSAAAVLSALQVVERQRCVRPAWRSRLLDTPNGDRVVAEVSFEGADALVAKCYGDDTGAVTFRVMAALFDAIARQAAPVLAVPEPLAYDAGRRCLVQRRAPGAGLAALLEEGDAAEALGLAGEALAGLHGLDVPAAGPRDLAGHVEDLVHPHPLALAARLPGLRPRIEAVLGAIVAAVSRFRGAFAPRPLHRDFHPRQVFVDGSRVSVIDWDLHAFGDPALDVGNFLMCLETRDPAVSAATFLAGYRRRAPAGIEDRIPAYRSLGYLRRAAKHCRLAAPGWAARSESMLERAERCLAGGPRLEERT